MKNSSYNKIRKMRDILKLSVSWFLIILFIPHLLIYSLSKERQTIDQDLEANKQFLRLKMGNLNALLFYLRTNKFFRSLFYHRIGVVYSMFVQWYLPGDRYFLISKTARIGGGMIVSHPYATIINADSIGSGFNCRNCTTIGEKGSIDDRPIIGENVELGANVVIIGKINIGSNVKIGAGSVVVKDVPDNCVVAGNPARIIKTL